MSRISRFDWMTLALAAACLLCAPAICPAAEAGAKPPSTYDDMRWRLVGPFRGGWATIAAGVPGDPSTWYFGSADGGVWKTRDAGVTWQPIFNRMGSASIGALAVCAADPRVLWVGTGQIQQRYDIVDGDGVYRSTDGGATWSRIGLEDTRHIGAIWSDPRNPDVAVVAALGHVFGPNPQRGLFRTSDAGRHWEHVLDRGPDVGAADIAGDPAQPDILFASLWQVRRHPWLDYFQPTVGPGSGIARSTDGGKSWTVLPRQGLPSGPLGRIELAIVPGTQSRGVWAVIQAGEGGGLYRSDDSGNSWKLINGDASLPSSYMSGLVPDPGHADILWSVGRSLRVSKDGGRTFRYAKGSPGGDDYHFLWIDPSDARRMITAADQGAVLTLNGGETWSSWYNQPTGQFYRLGIDDRFPYWIYSGQQDSGTVAIASRSDYGQLTFRDWHPVGGDERDGDHPDPANPDIVYGAGLGGRISRWDAATAQVQNVAPWPVASYGARPGTGRYRYDWITPLAIAPRPPHAIYSGAQVLFRSLDAGRSWQTVSADLTGADPKAKHCDGDVPLARATRCGFGAIFAITPSPAADGVVWVGTDNGRVLLTRDDAKSWTNVTPPGLPDWTRVNQIDASPADAGIATVAVDGHRRDDFHPLAFRTRDYGAHWREIGKGLPAGSWVGVVREDPRRAGLLYAGTSRGVWVSFDDGMTWQTLQLNLPTTGINDMRVQGDDLVVATQGRAIWILDQLAPLRDRSASGTDLALVRPGVATRLRANQNKDTPLPFEEPRGENPPIGAIIDYVLPKGAASPVTLEVLDASGAVVRRFSSDEAAERPKADVYFTDMYLKGGDRLSVAPGHHRFVWNLRSERPDALEYEYSIAAVPGRETAALPEGALVLPGSYRLRLAAGGATVQQPLEVAMDPRCKTSSGDLAALATFQRQVGQALARTAAAGRERREAIDFLSKAHDRPEAAKLAVRIAKRKAELEALPAGREEDPVRANGVLASLASDLESADAPPTAPQKEMLALYEKSAAAYETKWKSFQSGPYADLMNKLKAMGITGARP